MTKKVIIVNAGGFGELSAKKGDYDGIIAPIKEALEEEQESSFGTGKEKPAEVTVVKTLKEAEEKVAFGSLGYANVVVFITRGMLSEAKKIKATYPRVKVVVMTGLLPEDEVVLIDKTWLCSRRSIREHIL